MLTQLPRARSTADFIVGALACVLLYAPLVAYGDAVDGHPEALELRLDGNLDQGASVAADPAIGTLLNFGRSDLQRRLYESQQRTRLLNLENTHVKREIDINSTLIKRLQQLSDSHGQATQTLHELVRIRVQPAPLAGPAVVADFEPRVKVVRLPAGALAVHTNLLVGLEDWVLVAGLGGFIVLLLIWILRLNAQQRALLTTGTPFAGIAHVPTQKKRDRHTPRPQDKPVTQPTTSATAVDEKITAVVQPEQTLAPVSKPASRNTASAELKEIDTLIAFEQFNQARDKLKVLLQRDPANPEYLLRDYHLRTAGDVDADEGDEAMLRELMDGPLSDTLLRVKSLGQSMMPGDPLFDDEASRDEACRMLEVARQSGKAKADAATEFNSTQIMSCEPKSD